MCRTNSTHQSVFPLVAEICMYKKCSAVSRLMSEVMSLESALVESEDNKLKNGKKKKNLCFSKSYPFIVFNSPLEVRVIGSRSGCGADVICLVSKMTKMHFPC